MFLLRNTYVNRKGIAEDMVLEEGFFMLEKFVDPLPIRKMSACPLILKILR